MICGLKARKAPNHSLSWDDYYPRTYNYDHTDEIERLTKRIDQALEDLSKKK